MNDRNHHAFAAAVWLVVAAVLPGAAGPVHGAGPELPQLTIESGNPRLPGKFVWADLVTDDLRAAQKFYAQMFNWDFRPYGDYLIAFNDDRPLCGMFQRPRPAGADAKPR